MRFPFKVPSVAAFDAVGFGTNAVDHLIRVDAYPKFGSKIELNDVHISPGGEIASTMAGLSRLGLKTAYAGRFGDDIEGKLGIESLIEEDVDIKFTEVVSGARTQVAYIVIDEESGERTIIWKRDKKLAYRREEAPLELAALGRVLHFTPHDPAACVAMASQAKRDGVIVSIDVDRVFDGIDELLPLVDVCIGSSEFPAALTGMDDPLSALRAIYNRYGCPVTGLTLGVDGSIVFCNGEFIRSSGFDVPGGCVDTTGAGDAFRTGILYGLLSDYDVELAATSANAVASLKCRLGGSRAGLPYRWELERFLSETEPRST